MLESKPHRLAAVAAVAAAAIVSMLGLSSAHAGGAEVQARVSAQHMGSDSLDAVTGDNLFASSGIGAAYRADPLGPVTLSLTVGWDGGRKTGNLFRRVETTLQVDRLVAGVRAEYPLWDRLRAHGQLSVGRQWTTLRLRDPFTGAIALEDTDRGVVAGADVGLDVQLVGSDASRHSLLFRVELGYVGSASAHLVSKSTGDGDLRIDTAAAPLGDLELSGATFRVGLAWRF